MRPRTLLVLLIMVVALGAFIRFYEHDQPSTDERAQRAKKVLDLKTDQVTRVRLDADGSTVVLERVGAPPKTAAKPPAPSAAGLDGGLGAAASAVADQRDQREWRIVQPLGARADSAAVSRLLETLSNLEKTRTIEKVAPADVGLDKPRAKVSLTVAGQSGETVLEVGAAVPTGGETLVAVAGNPDAYVVNDGLLADVRKPAGDWRDHQIFHGDRDAVERLSWTIAGGPRVVLAKRGDRFWLESPIVDRADRDQVEKLLTDLTGLTAEKFVDSPPAAAAAPVSSATAPASSVVAPAAAAPAPPAQLGLEPPHAVVEAVLAGQAQPFHVDLGASHPASPQAPPPAEPGAPPPAPSNVTYARAGNVLFETRSTLADTVARPPADWRSPQLSGLEVHQVDAAAVRDGKGAVALTRSGTDWKRGAVTISYLPVSDLLFAVTEAKGDRLLTGPEAQALAGPAGLATPALTLELKAGTAGNETLSLYPPLTGATHGVLARASGRDTVLLLPESKLKDIQDKLAAVRTAPPLAPEKPAKPAAPTGKH